MKDYLLIKRTFGCEPYLDILASHMRNYFTRLRFSTLNLQIETGRYNHPPIPCSERFCFCCNATDIEDTYHFFFLCPSYNGPRKRLFPVYFRNRPSLYKYTELL